MARINATEAAESAIMDVLYSIKTLGDLDLDDLKETAHDSIPELCYFGEFEEAIRLYESDYWRDAECFLGSEETYSPADWRKAIETYGAALYYCAVQSEIEDVISTLETQIDEFREAVESLGGDPDNARISNDCEYGWEAHNYESESGIMFWNDKKDVSFAYNPRKLEGELYAVSMKLDCGAWLNVCWNPEENNESEE